MFTHAVSIHLWSLSMKENAMGRLWPEHLDPGLDWDAGVFREEDYFGWTIRDYKLFDSELNQNSLSTKTKNTQAPLATLLK